jgi:hypothetical protein
MPVVKEVLRILINLLIYGGKFGVSRGQELSRCFFGRHAVISC